MPKKFSCWSFSTKFRSDTALLLEWLLMGLLYCFRPGLNLWVPTTSSSYSMERPPALIWSSSLTSTKDSPARARKSGLTRSSVTALLLPEQGGELELELLSSSLFFLLELTLVFLFITSILCVLEDVAIMLFWPPCDATMSWDMSLRWWLIWGIYVEDDWY